MMTFYKDSALFIWENTNTYNKIKIMEAAGRDIWVQTGQ